MSLLGQVEGSILSRLGRVSITARQAVESLLSGQHRCIHRGLSVEFAGHRPYALGDDLRRLDWQVYARTDRYEIRQYEEETRLQATIVVDCSGSMGYGGKLPTACALAAVLATLMLRQGDQVSLAMVDTGIRSLLPPGGTMSHLVTLLERLEEQAPGGETALGPVLETLADRLRRRGLVFLISDCLDDPLRLGKAIRHLIHRRQEVRIIQVLDKDEVSFPFRGSLRMLGLEKESPITIDADRVRAEYRNALAEHRSKLVQVCREAGAHCNLCQSDEDLALFLGHLLTEAQ